MPDHIRYINVDNTARMYRLCIDWLVIIIHALYVLETTNPNPDSVSADYDVMLYPAETLLLEKSSWHKTTHSFEKDTTITVYDEMAEINKANE